MMTMQTRVQPDPAVLATTLPDQEVVLLHVRTNYYYTLNATGAQIWQGIQAQQTVGEISQALVERYALSLTEAEAAVRTLLTQLTAATLVQEVATQ
jgi:hypothetical protein